VAGFLQQIAGLVPADWFGGPTGPRPTRGPAPAARPPGAAGAAPEAAGAAADAQAPAAQLHQAMGGVALDEVAAAQTLSAQSPATMPAVSAHYQRLAGAPLEEDLADRLPAGVTTRGAEPGEGSAAAQAAPATASAPAAPEAAAQAAPATAAAPAAPEVATPAAPTAPEAATPAATEAATPAAPATAAAPGTVATPPAPTAATQAAAATQDAHAIEARQALGAKMDKMPDLSPEKRARIAERLNGLTGEALVAETQAIERSLSGPNGERALSTYSDLAELSASDPRAKDRLSPELVAMLVTGVGDRASDSDRGQAGLMGGMQARQAASALLAMNEADYGHLVGVLKKAGTGPDGQPAAGADPHAEQTLLLKGLAARRDAYGAGASASAGSGPDAAAGPSPAEQATSQLDTFASQIRGEGRESLVNRTTLRDVDDANTSTMDPKHPTQHNDTKGDNDGLRQRYRNSCVPTTMQLMRGDLDPIYAAQVHAEGIDDLDPAKPTAREERDMLRAHGSDSSSVLGTDAKANLGAQSTKAGLSNAETLKLNDLIQGHPGVEGEAALAKLRAANDGHPTDAELRGMEDNAGVTKDAGMTARDAVGIAEGAAHLGLTERWVNGMDFDPANPGRLKSTGVPDAGVKHLDGIEKRLEDGQPVPFGMDWQSGGRSSGHQMYMSDVRKGPDGERMFLVSDPGNGATRWVKEKDLRDNSWYDKTFMSQPTGVTAEISDIVVGKDQTV
jgi:hypothetical protein